MRPEDLINQNKGGQRITDDQQIAFDAQCFKEFASQAGYHPSWAKSLGSGEDGLAPWSKMEEELGLTLPFYICGRRVDRYNLLSLAMGKVKSELVEVFADVCELAEAAGRPPAMIFKYGGDKRQHVAGTKMVMTPYVAVRGWLDESSFSGVLIRASQFTPASVLLSYKDWRQELMNGYGHIFE